jgi:hypothetical protein
MNFLVLMVVQLLDMVAMLKVVLQQPVEELVMLKV